FMAWLRAEEVALRVEHEKNAELGGFGALQTPRELYGDRAWRIHQVLRREAVRHGVEFAAFVEGKKPWPAPVWPLPNVVQMVSAENQEQLDRRVPHLLRFPAWRRGVSVEPMLGPVSIAPYLMPAGMPG